MRTLSTPVWSALLLLSISDISSGRMSRDDEGHFSEPHTETEESQQSNMPMDPKSMLPSYPQEEHFPIPGGENSEKRNSERDGRSRHPVESWQSGSMSYRGPGRQLPTSHYGNDRAPQQTEYSNQSQRSHGTSHNYNYRPVPPGREYRGRVGNNYDLNDVPGGSYDIYGVHEQARPTRPPEYSSGSRWPAEDGYGYNRGHQVSGGEGDSRGAYQHRYPQQSPYPYGQNRERDYRPRQPYQPEPAEVALGERRYDNVNPRPRYPQSYEPPYERSSYS